MAHALSSVDDGADLIPFVLRVDAGETTIHRYVAEQLEESVSLARRSLVDEAEAQRAVLAYDGYTTIEGERMDTLFVEAFEQGGSSTLSIAQRTRTTGWLKKKRRSFGDPILVSAEADPLF